MNFNRHSELEGRHAFLSPSKYHWINYENEKFDDVYRNHMMARRGDQLHAFAFEAIRLGIKLPRTSATLNLYVNDAIGYRMTPEQTLAYSNNAFGTADAISFKKKKLRIHDLKTGVTKTSEKQLMVYAALFCLEYDVRPADIEIELRIYQSDDVRFYIPELEEIVRIMDRIITFDKRIEQLKAEVM